ncbi:MAG TPA: NADH-quinone oxidoreductase subunit NuoE [Gammaproteobacteria bacterium]|nr:NADH-quinone oxidoreductase subunit NuoE [Gammaproteobacteria bacterium]
MTVGLSLLSYKTKKDIDQWLTKYPSNQRQSAVLYALKVVQTENKGWLTESLMDAVAAYLGMPKIAVYEVATFYNLFELKPVGKHKISVCTNISCMLCDSESIVQHLKQRLGINMGETTPDGQFTLKEVECLAACGGAPAVQIGRVYHEKVTPEKIDTILSELAELGDE